MKKILPRLYKGNVKSISKNQDKSILNKVKENVKNVVVNEDEKTVDNQIRDIFSSPSYVYKADVNIILNDGTELKKTIIGRTNNSLITMDDELIDVSKISKIDFI